MKLTNALSEVIRMILCAGIAIYWIHILWDTSE